MITVFKAKLKFSFRGWQWGRGCGRREGTSFKYRSGF